MIDNCPMKFLTFIFLVISFHPSLGFVCHTKRQPSNGPGNVHKVAEGNSKIWYYNIDNKTVGGSMLNTLNQVIEYYMQVSCIKLIKVADDFSVHKTHIRFEGNYGCVTVWGGTRRISIGLAGCGPKGTSHEIGHALGWGHEQGRLDGIKSINYRTKDPGYFIDILGIPYDIFSVMQYPSPWGYKGLDWLTRDRKYTWFLSATYLDQPMKGDNIMTFNDVKRLNFQLQCNATCSNINTTWCENEGYLNGSTHRSGDPCQCTCPYGAEGDRCQDGAAKFYPDVCGGEYTNDAVIYTPRYNSTGKSKANDRCAYLFKGKPGKTIKVVWNDFELGRLVNKQCKEAFADVRTRDVWNANYYFFNVLSQKLVEAVLLRFNGLAFDEDTIGAYTLCGDLVPKDGTQITSVGMDLFIGLAIVKEYPHGKGFKATVTYEDPSPMITCDVDQKTKDVDVPLDSEPIVVGFTSKGEQRTCKFHFKTRWPKASIQIKLSYIDAKGSDCDTYTLVFNPDPSQSSSTVYKSCNNETFTVSSVGGEMTLQATFKRQTTFVAEVLALSRLNQLENRVHACNGAPIKLKLGDKKLVTSPSYYGLLWSNLQYDITTPYPPNVNCSWIFESDDPKVKSISLNFEYKGFKLPLKELSIDCPNDRLTATDANGKSIQVCKKANYVLKGNKAELNFISDAIVTSATGFLAYVTPNA